LTASDVLQAVERGEGRLALAAYETAAREAEAAGAMGTAVRSGAAACTAAKRLGMVQKAETLCAHVIELGPKAPPTFNVCRAVLLAYNQLGRLYRSVGNVAGARRVFEQGAVYGRSPALSSVGIVIMSPRSLVLVGLSQARIAQGDRPGGLTAAQEGVSLLEASETQRVGERGRHVLRRQAVNAYLQLARVYMGDKRLDDAAAALARASHYAGLVKAEELQVDIDALAAQVALDRNDAAGALALAAETRASAERLNMGAKVGDLDRIAAYANWKLGNVDEALTAARSALAHIEDARADLQSAEQRATFLDNRQSLYHFAAHLALRAGKPEEAFAIAERSRSRAFLDLLGNARLSRGKTQNLAQEEMRLRARIAEAAALAQSSEEDDEGTIPTAAREQVAAAERDYRAFLERVRKEDVEQASLMTVDPVTLPDIQGILPDDTMLLEYFVSAQDVVLFLVDRQHLEVRRIAGDRASLLADVRDFRVAIASQSPPAEIESRADTMYRRLLGPAGNAIRNRRRLVIVPHDVLHYLPFAALRTPAGKWLVEAHGLATVPSASVLKFLADKGAQASDRILAVGNPDLGPALALRYAEREVRAVGERYPTTSTVLTRADASESRVKQLASQAGLLHFAVHGELDEQDPMASALLLTPGQGEDGRLEVRELFATELHARLVVLSACDTGLGKLSRGDELIGLQRAFLYAGTPDVVTTLWKVDDRASYMLMRAFYEALPSKGPMEALRTAQRSLMVDFPHPFAWAAFELTGAPR
jgi:CHAT domain-containing protein